jgi:hypothetical protein
MPVRCCESAPFLLLSIPMALLSPPSSAFVPATPAASGLICSLQRSGSLWQLGIEAQELTPAIAQLAEQLEANDDDTRPQALPELEAALLAEESNKAALAAKAVATCWVIEHLRGQAAYRPGVDPPCFRHAGALAGKDIAPTATLTGLLPRVAGCTGGPPRLSQRPPAGAGPREGCLPGGVAC